MTRHGGTEIPATSSNPQATSINLRATFSNLQQPPGNLLLQGKPGFSAGSSTSTICDTSMDETSGKMTLFNKAATKKLQELLLSEARLWHIVCRASTRRENAKEARRLMLPSNFRRHHMGRLGRCADPAVKCGAGGSETW